MTIKPQTTHRDFKPEDVRLTIGGPCETCNGTQRLINRGGPGGLVPLEDGESRDVTSEPCDTPGSNTAHIVKVGQVCPCPKCEAWGPEIVSPGNMGAS